MNRKQVAVTSILIFFMFLLAITQHLFNGNFERINSVESILSKEKQYKFNSDNYMVCFPKEWMINDQDNILGYVECRLKFYSPNNNVNGMLEIINTEQDIQTFSNKDLRHQSLNYQNCKNEVFDFKNFNGVVYTYSTSIADKYHFNNECYYIKLSDNKLMKILFNYRSEYYSDNARTICREIVTSIKSIK